MPIVMLEASQQMRAILRFQRDKYYVKKNEERNSIGTLPA
jgi:hypothetical protein